MSKEERRGRHRSDHPQVSLLVPFRADPDSPQRQRIWTWMEEYWRHELPYAEIVVGDSRGKVFSKAQAVNNAARRSHGRVLVILDSDAYLPGSVITKAANSIEKALRRERRLWLIPFRMLYRLTEETTEEVLNSDPKRPKLISSPPYPDQVESTLGSMHGRRFGALIQIMPREAFDEVCGMDPRFDKGWGSEDICLVRALDTLYAKHKTTKNDVLHLWHETIGANFKDRMWAGQTNPRANEQLAMRYNRATGDRAKMRALVDEGCKEYKKEKLWYLRFWAWLRSVFD